MSERRDNLARIIREHCKNQKRGDLQHIMKTLEGIFKNYKLVAVHIPQDRIIFGEEYIDEECRKQEADPAGLRRYDPMGLMH